MRSKCMHKAIPNKWRGQYALRLKATQEILGRHLSSKWPTTKEDQQGRRRAEENFQPNRTWRVYVKSSTSTPVGLRDKPSALPACSAAGALLYGVNIASSREILCSCWPPGR